MCLKSFDKASHKYRCSYVHTLSLVLSVHLFRLLRQMKHNEAAEAAIFADDPSWVPGSTPYHSDRWYGLAHDRDYSRIVKRDSTLRRYHNEFFSFKKNIDFNNQWWSSILICVYSWSFISSFICLAFFPLLLCCWLRRHFRHGFFSSSLQLLSFFSLLDCQLSLCWLYYCHCT